MDTTTTTQQRALSADATSMPYGGSGTHTQVAQDQQQQNVQEDDDDDDNVDDSNNSGASSDGSVPDSDDDLTAAEQRSFMAQWMKPRTNPGIRVGPEFQASLPPPNPTPFSAKRGADSGQERASSLQAKQPKTFTS
ncbi:hypothetical protein PTSG_07697 [Salpingoeca rosetta]|uniref:Uncharacterized protein n=1 Tax=Salpingoeca rosetta (strain ATCC 50818 / BSB-021) TaxID=946362 RepID=F2UHI1_SALR5|nr:uncharacterized protein PTSG_07697 [Salpingoeca rosetta]EGD76580.1 hypothetical protein PTSG_07697 [Salpingoeca rosetta]|eukprot:XP_004991494.1 hypothetical protein PTSG_07697 [Salpingoeca rosetta]